MYDLVRTPRFDRHLARFERAHPELRKRVGSALRDLRTDPFQPHLGLHALRGDLAGLRAVTITYRYRILLTIEIREREIVLIDIGSHDEVYG